MRNIHTVLPKEVFGKLKQKLIKTAEHYLQQEYGSRVPDCRFDVISASGEPVMFDWLKNVFG